MRTLRIIFCLLLFTSSVSTAFSQTNELEIFIPLEEVEYEENDKTIPERDICLLSILPEVVYDTIDECLSIVSPHVTFEAVTYYIIDEAGIIVATDEIVLPKNVEHTIDISLQPAGVYRILLEIDGVYFVGEFTNNQF